MSNSIVRICIVPESFVIALDGNDALLFSSGPLSAELRAIVAKCKEIILRTEVRSSFIPTKLKHCFDSDRSDMTHFDAQS